jgi:hypothetical protein
LRGNNPALNSLHQFASTIIVPLLSSHIAMRRLLGLLLFIGIGYIIYTKFLPSREKPPYTLPEKIACRNTFREADGSVTVSVNLVNGDRWRVEQATKGSPNIFVGVFDGAHFTSNLKVPDGSVEMIDPRPDLRKLIEGCARQNPDATQTKDGHSCWRFHTSKDGNSMQIWIDTQTRFLVSVEGILRGKNFFWRYEILSVDLDRSTSQYFNPSSLTPQFLPLLKVP